MVIFDYALQETITEYFALRLYLYVEWGTIKLLKPEPVLNKALSKFADFDLLGILLVDEKISFKKCDRRLNANFAWVTLAT